jgi:hypothetical protein
MGTDLDFDGLKVLQMLRYNSQNSDAFYSPIGNKANNENLRVSLSFKSDDQEKDN